MKQSYFLKTICLAALCSWASSSSAMAENLNIFTEIGLKVSCDESSTDVVDDITVNIASLSWNVCGIWVTSTGSLGNVSANINCINPNPPAMYGIRVEEGGTIGTISGTMKLAPGEGHVVGYMLGSLDGVSCLGLSSAQMGDEVTGDSYAVGDSTGFDVDWTSMSFDINHSNCSSGNIARGIYLNREGSSIATGEGEYIGGTIDVLNEYDGDSDCIAIDIDNKSHVGDIGKDAVIKARCKVNGDSTAIMLQNGSSIGEIAGKITATAKTDNATGIYVRGSEIGTIKGTIKASSTKGQGTGIDYNTTQQLVFSGASITAESAACLGTAIRNTEQGIRIMSECGTVTTIQGNLDAGTQALSFDSGDFVVKSNTWTASSTSIGSVEGTAHVDLQSDLKLQAPTLDFYINTESDYSNITIANGFSLDSTQLTSINVYLSDEVMAMGEFDFTLIDGEIACLNEVQVNYILESPTTSGTLSHGSAEDGSSFIVSLRGGDANVPEPSTTSLGLIALASMLLRRRRSR
ncbi:MAG: PEP-CTERM sorting domain-containing protein [Akkermansia sp.]